ncbi:8310_t:CDS:2 [Dentiscutata erythropus]|uniref:8310_t:CDS:1 n=1 Tax=Dentiscutata erythropus TaxID=1348616 RepID=A0A9N9N8K7_9GLOM|nr:8310_t:CDS:2 [Dentiscutata erythropus]
MEYKPKTTRDKREYDVTPDKNITNTIKTEKRVATKRTNVLMKAVEKKENALI